MGSCVSHLQNLWSKIPHIQKRQTRIIPTDDEELQDCNWQYSNHAR